uniref:Uncharacterized protein n=1 Tax=Mustela putorius furo TaxID=9669 RepID=M3Y128_MUSPF
MSVTEPECGRRCGGGGGAVRGGAGARLPGKLHTSLHHSGAKEGDRAVSLTPPRTCHGVQGHLCLAPPEEPAPGRASAPPHLGPQGWRQRQLQAPAGDHTVTRAHSRLHLTFGDHYFFPRP